MQKYHLLILLVILTQTSPAQSFYEYFNIVEEIACPYDPGSNLIWPENWRIYHTRNDHWDGEVDSNWCISLDLLVSPPFVYPYLDAAQIDGDRPVFIRYTGFEAKPFSLPSDWLYSLETTVSIEDDVSLKIGQSTPPKSGVIVSIDIPAEDSVSRDQRIRHFEFLDSTHWPSVYACIATEKFVDQKLQEIIIALSFRHTKSKGRLVEFERLAFQMGYDFGVVNETLVDPHWWEDTSYVVPINALATNGAWANAFILPHSSPAYPSSANISYLDLDPVIPSDTAQTITVEVEGHLVLVPQPFTAFRGALVNSTDSMRHLVQLLNNGGDICIQSAEINFEGGSSYLHKAGTVSLGSDLSCMMFKSDASLDLAERAHLDYGHQGMGFLAMKEGSQLTLNTGAEMTIHNTLVLQKSPTTNHTDPTVYLYSGSRLAFGKSGTLEAWGDALKLRVMMLGGTFDSSNLSAHELGLIEFIYPEIPATTQGSEIITLVKHPSAQALNVHMSFTHGFQGTLRVFDAIGRPISSETIDVPGHDYYHTLQLNRLSSGWYVVSLETPSGLRSAAFTIIE